MGDSYNQHQEDTDNADIYDGLLHVLLLKKGWMLMLEVHYSLFEEMVKLSRGRQGSEAENGKKCAQEIWP